MVSIAIAFRLEVGLFPTTIRAYMGFLGRTARIVPLRQRYIERA
jgi:hypothetical protein